ncbi:protein of unknown function DUF343 [Methanotorris formicicus Mc-S-70]|uniref:Uncharacterized protein n=2 Tax=Methanotorris formicicus TaxID=213185 RepID=H1KYR5_9EURY|nr:protein of unknown function DUF343 [Methanotorris formicicus Mc-S-70]
MSIGEFMDWIGKYLSILQCPYCGGDLEYIKEKNQLICKSCKRIFDIVDGILILLKN